MNAPSIRRWLVDAAQRIDAALGPARVERLVLPPLVEKPGGKWGRSSRKVTLTPERYPGLETLLA